MKKFLMIIISSVIVLMSSVPVFAAIAPSELNAYLAEVDLTADQFDEYLSSWEIDIDDYDSVDDLRADLGERLTPEVLAAYLAENNITEDELKELLIENGELESGQEILDADNLYFTSDLDYYLDTEEPLTDEDYEALKPEIYAEMKEILDELSITQAEFYKFYDHVNNVRKDTDIMSALEEMEILAEDLMSVGEFESVDEISEEEIANMLAIYDEIQRIFQVDFKYALIEDGVEKQISLRTLLEIEDVKEDTSLKVYVYDKAGNLLLDLIITPEMFGDDVVKDIGTEIKDVTKTTPVKTEKGGKLPKTAGDYTAGMLIGLLLMAGSFVFMKKAGSVK